MNEQVAKLAHRLAPALQLPTNWDKFLPEYCYIDLGSKQLVIAKVKEQFVVSLVNGASVRSEVVYDVSQAFLVETEPEGVSNGVRTGVAPKNPHTALADPNSVNENRADPNLPPGFENEYELGHQYLGPRLEFNPDGDRLPPGGAYPGLTPFPNAGVNPSMNPSMNPTSNPPNIRYDPTSPFDSTPQPFRRNQSGQSFQFGPPSQPGQFGQSGPFGSGGSFRGL